MTDTCRRCGAEMKPGKALQSTVTAGEKPAARIHVQGHAYVPAEQFDAIAMDKINLRAENEWLRAELEELVDSTKRLKCLHDIRSVASATLERINHEEP